jgi:hypothetical protein
MHLLKMNEMRSKRFITGLIYLISSCDRKTNWEIFIYLGKSGINQNKFPRHYF